MRHKLKRGSACLTVVLRKRPLTASERSKSDGDIIRVSEDKKTVTVMDYRKDLSGLTYLQEHSYDFDYIFEESSTNLEMYVSCVLPLVKALFEKKGSRCSVFAYGQTGSGKTYTVVGPSSVKRGRRRDRGLAEIALYDTFKMKEQMPNGDVGGVGETHAGIRTVRRHLRNLL